MYLIDTNIFLEVIRDRENADQCQKLLEKTLNGEINALVTDFTVHAVEGHTTERTDVVRDFLENIERSFGLETVKTSVNEEKEAAELSRETGLDFDDSLQHYVARKKDLDAIISFDTDFDSTSIERKLPQDLI